MGYHHLSQIVIADSNPLEQLGISAIVSRAFAWDALEMALDFEQLEFMVTANTSLVLLDLNLPGLTTHGHIRKLRLASPSTKVVVVSAPCGVETLLSVLGNGVHGIVPKTLGQSEFVSALRMIAKGQLYVPCELSDGALLATRHQRGHAEPTKHLSARQREVLTLAAQGNSNKEIARSLNIAEATVKVHVSAAFRVMGVSNRAGAVAALSSYEDPLGHLHLLH